MTGDARRLLIVEFLNTDRFSQYRSDLLPFVRGFAEAHDVPVRWVCFGFDPDTLPTSRYLMRLADGDVATLRGVLAAHRPTHVVCNEELDGPLAEALGPALGGAVWMTVGFDPPFTFERRQLLERWLGLEGGEETVLDPTLLVDAAEPRYACELANDLARTIRPFVHVVAGPGCLYHRPLRRNPRYRDVDLDAAHRDFGCSFCGVGRDTRYPYATAPVPLALKQVRAALATPPEARRDGGVGVGQFVMTGAVLFHRLHELFAAVLEARLPPAEFLFACRIDELRRKAPRIDAVLPRLRAAGHTISIANMGVENFSPEENERFNKGITADDVAAVLEHVTRWERDYPGTFRFHETGGFGFILFTPWTRLDDLRINLREAERFGVHPDSFFFVSRLQLHRGRPIHRLAERDGVLLAEGDDPAGSVLAPYQTSSVMSVHDDDLPWRFVHPEVAPVYGLFLRIHQASARGVERKVAPDDPDFVRVRRLRARLPLALRSPYPLLGAAVDAAAAHPEVRRVDALLDRLEARLAPHLGAVDEELLRREDEAERETPADRAERAALEAQLRALLPLLRDHPKRLLRGFDVGAVTARPTGAGWGELHVALRSEDGHLGVRILPRAAAAAGFVTTPRFTVMHDGDTPADTEDKRRVLDVIGRGLERYVAAREPGRGAA